MNYNSIMKVAVAAALLFGVNMEADAQFGKLKNLAKKARRPLLTTQGRVTPYRKPWMPSPTTTNRPRR